VTVNYELDRMWKEAVAAYFKVLSLKKTQRISVVISWYLG
jgi:hypothetical protein